MLGIHVWCEVPSLVTQQLSALAHAWCAGKQKVASSLTDVWQQLFEQQDITVICAIHFHPGCMKTTPVHQRLETPTETDIQEHVYQKPWQWATSVSWRLIETWSAASTASLIKRLISGEIVLMRVSKTKANTEYLLWCFSVTVMTFKAYVTAVMNKLTYVSFHKVGWEQPSGEVANFVAVLLQIYFSICVPKVIKI